MCFLKMWKSVLVTEPPVQRGFKRIAGWEQPIERLRCFGDSYKQDPREALERGLEIRTPGHILLAGGEIASQRTIANAFAEEYDLDVSEVDVRGMTRLGEIGLALSRTSFEIDSAKLWEELRQAEKMQTGAYSWTDEQRAVLKRRSDAVTVKLNEARQTFNQNLEINRGFPEMGLTGIRGILFLPDIHRLDPGLAPNLDFFLRNFYIPITVRETGSKSKIQFPAFTCLATATSEADCPRALDGVFSLTVKLQTGSSLSTR